MSDLVVELMILVKRTPPDPSEAEWTITRQVQVLQENIEDINSVVDDNAL